MSRQLGLGRFHRNKNNQEIRPKEGKKKRAASRVHDELWAVRLHELAVHCWWDFGLYVQSLKADWGSAVGCRRPPGVDIRQALPGFPYEVTGHRTEHMMQSRSFASHRSRPPCNGCLTSPSRPDPAGVNINIAGAEVHSAFYVPLSSSVSREERHGIVLSYFFQECDTVVSEVGLADQRTTPHTLISGCGDLNMTPELKLLFESCLQDRGLWWATPLTAAAHVKGGIFDLLWCERDNAKLPPNLHDGRVCRSNPLQRQPC